MKFSKLSIIVVQCCLQQEIKNYDQTESLLPRGLAETAPNLRRHRAFAVAHLTVNYEASCAHELAMGRAESENGI